MRRIQVRTASAAGVNFRAGLSRHADKRNQAGAGNIVDTPHAHTTKPLWRQYFDGNHHNELGLGTAPANALLNAAHLGFIDLDRAMETILPRPHHGRAQLLQEGPGGLITSQSQQALQAECADSMLLVGHVPGCGKPFLRRNPGAVEDGPCRERYFAAADRASPAPICRSPAFSHLTLWTTNPAWPSQLLKIRDTSLLVGKPRAKLLPCSRIRRVNFRSWRSSDHYI